MQGWDLVLDIASVDSSLWSAEEAGWTAGPEGCSVGKEEEGRLAYATFLGLPHLTSNCDDLQSIRAAASFHFRNHMQVCASF